MYTELNDNKDLMVWTLFFSYR